jgi:hypothetical protein
VVCVWSGQDVRLITIRSRTACRSQIMRSRVECIHFAAPCRGHYTMYLHLNPHTTHLYQTPAGIPKDPHCEEHKCLDSNAPAQTYATPRYLFAQSPKCGPGMEIKKDITKMQMETRSREKANCPNAGNGETHVNKTSEDDWKVEDPSFRGISTAQPKVAQPYFQLF